MDINFIINAIVEALQNIWGAIVYIWPFVWKTLELFIGTVIVKYIILHWVADQIQKWFKRIVIRTKQQAILWVHYREKAMGHGHKYKSPETCQDGVCRAYNTLTLPKLPF